METTLTVNQQHISIELSNLMEEFRWMVNESIRIGVDQNLSSLKSLNGNLYHYLCDNTKFLKLYVCRAIIVAKSILKKFRKSRRKNPNAKIPHCKRSYLIVDKQSYKIIGNTLLIGTKPKQPYAGIPLNHYTMKRITEPLIRTGALIITSNAISISITKDTESIKTTEFVGIDINLNNISAVHSDGTTEVFSEVSKITKIKERYRIVKSHFRRNDVRIRRKIFQKYGILQKHRTKQILHRISKTTVTQKKQMIFEDLRGIRNRCRKGNGHGKKYHVRLNSWPFYELQRQLEYKSKWHNGITVIKVNPNKTSSMCSTCGAKMIPEKNRQIRCQCGHAEDRDINAARNILYKGVPILQLRGLRLRPDAPQSEAMKQSKDAEQIVASVRYRS